MGLSAVGSTMTNVCFTTPMKFFNRTSARKTSKTQWAVILAIGLRCKVTANTKFQTFTGVVKVHISHFGTVTQLETL